MRIFRRWRVKKVHRRLLELDYVYDVMMEEPVQDRFLIHIWVNELSPERREELEPRIREIVRRRPRHIKVDVHLYRRDAG
ncbi:hypothetical protein LLE49_19455 [Alicyclobacillus tolerans]|uniref:hypothetical protein n=1 Tax=Alicyclobacillus tolerans TaxID=90970 RepID=UPI001F373063|nr:hypothetical protein [Alicyclobacillus tolerans]MCF8566899.1 hypothetical protein [Alicyclobacillus tolerans]